MLKFANKIGPPFLTMDLLASKAFLEACVDERRRQEIGRMCDEIDQEYRHWAAEQYSDLDAKPVWPSALAAVLANFDLAPGLVMEFGVCTGTSTNAIARSIAPEKVYGFDSFEGWPDDWTFRNMRVPKDFIAVTPERDLLFEANVELVKGFFADTIPAFLESHPGPVSMLHIDCDTYGSTVDILRNLHGRIQVGTIVVFDEILGDMGLENELMALSDLLKDHQFGFEWLGRGGHCWTADVDATFKRIRRTSILGTLQLAVANLGSIWNVMSNRKPFDQVLSAAALRITSIP